MIPDFLSNDFLSYINERGLIHKLGLNRHQRRAEACRKGRGELVPTEEVVTGLETAKSTNEVIT
jgi:hypothetical protein